MKKPVSPPLPPFHATPQVGLRLDVADCGAVADGTTLNTAVLQAALDRITAAGGGELRFGPGRWCCGSLKLGSHTTIRLDEGAVLLGSSDCHDFSDQAQLVARDAVGLRVLGPGVIDGVDCFDATGEGGHRGRHGIWLERCRDVVIRDAVFQHIGNWGVAAWHCTDLSFERFTVLGGFDGIDLGDCARARIADSVFETGDDCLAGAGNRDVLIEDCLFNSSCNPIRFSALRLTVRRCRFEGPGRYEHRFSGGRTNTLAALVHFSPNDRAYRGPAPHSDDWLIEDCTISGIDCLYEYDGGHFWQDGRTAGRTVFRRVEARGLIQPVVVYGRCHGGDRLIRHCQLEFEDAVLEPRVGWEACGFFDLRRHGGLSLTRTRLLRNGSATPIRAIDGGRVIVDDLQVEALPGGADASTALRGANHWVIETPAAPADPPAPDLSGFPLVGCQPAGDYVDGPLRGRWFHRPGVEDLLVVWSVRGEVEAALRGAVTAVDETGQTPPSAPRHDWHQQGGPNAVTTAVRIGRQALLLRGTGIEIVVG